MKKIIISMIVLAGITGSCNADSSNITTNNYIKEVNKSISQVQSENAIQQKATIKSLIFNGIESGYIEPSLQNEKVLNNSLKTFVLGLNNYKIDDIELNKKHKELLMTANDLIKLLDDRIECKSKTINSENKLMNIKYILIDDGENINAINDNIDKINNLCNEIKEFNNKFSISKLF